MRITRTRIKFIASVLSQDGRGNRRSNEFVWRSSIPKAEERRSARPTSTPNFGAARLPLILSGTTVLPLRRNQGSIALRSSDLNPVTVWEIFASMYRLPSNAMSSRFTP